MHFCHLYPHLTSLSLSLSLSVCVCYVFARLGTGFYAGKQKGLRSIPLRLSFLFEKVGVCGHRLVTLCLTIHRKHSNGALIAAHLNAGVTCFAF